MSASLDFLAFLGSASRILEGAFTLVTFREEERGVLFVNVVIAPCFGFLGEFEAFFNICWDLPEWA